MEVRDAQLKVAEEDTLKQKVDLQKLAEIIQKRIEEQYLDN